MKTHCQIAFATKSQKFSPAAGCLPMGQFLPKKPQLIFEFLIIKEDNHVDSAGEVIRIVSMVE